MESITCHFSIWGLLAFVTLALVVSLIINILYCIANKQKGQVYRDNQEYSPSCDNYTEERPVYSKLSQKTLEKCCYVQMKAQPQRLANAVKLSLDTTSRDLQ